MGFCARVRTGTFRLLGMGARAPMVMKNREKFLDHIFSGLRVIFESVPRLVGPRLVLLPAGPNRRRYISMSTLSDRSSSINRSGSRAAIRAIYRTAYPVSRVSN